MLFYFILFYFKCESQQIHHYLFVINDVWTKININVKKDFIFSGRN